MPNITVTIDHCTYRNVRIWCAMRNTSVSRVVQTFLNDLPRLENVRRFPTPEAPDHQSLGELFDRLEPAELELLRYQLSELEQSLPPSQL